jgi:hypothetical protein
MSFERKLSTKEFAAFIGFSYHTARRLILYRSGVLAIGKKHKTRMIPESLALRILDELKQGGR